MAKGKNEPANIVGISEEQAAVDVQAARTVRQDALQRLAEADADLSLAEARQAASRCHPSDAAASSISSVLSERESHAQAVRDRAGAAA